jgi:hypothetical protein
MVRLDRTIGFPKLVLTGLLRQMVRSSRTMTIKGRATRRSQRYFSAHGVVPEDRLPQGSHWVTRAAVWRHAMLGSSPRMTGILSCQRLRRLVLTA